MRKALCINMKEMKIGTPKIILVSFQSLRKIFEVIFKVSNHHPQAEFCYLSIYHLLYAFLPLLTSTKKFKVDIS